MNRDLPQLAHVDGLADRYRVAWSLERPLLPAPHQIAADLFASTLGTPLLRETADGMVLNPRNLFTHAWVTVSATLTGFVHRPRSSASHWRSRSCTSTRFA